MSLYPKYYCQRLIVYLIFTIRRHRLKHLYSIKEMWKCVKKATFTYVYDKFAKIHICPIIYELAIKIYVYFCVFIGLMEV